MDFKDIKGLWHVKRALEVAITGEHNILLIGCDYPQIGDLELAVKSVMGDVPLVKARKRNKDQNYSVTVVGRLVMASMLPCPCGNFTHPRIECHCTPHQIQRYLAKLPGDLLGMVDIHVEVPVVTHAQHKRSGEGSKTIKARIKEAQKYKKPTKMDKEGDELLKMAILEIGISASAYDKIVSVAGTIAQMDGKKKIKAGHVSEAIGYRSLDRNLWA